MNLEILLYPTVTTPQDIKKTAGKILNCQFRTGITKFTAVQDTHSEGKELRGKKGPIMIDISAKSLPDLSNEKISMFCLGVILVLKCLMIINYELLSHNKDFRRGNKILAWGATETG